MLGFFKQDYNSKQTTKTKQKRPLWNFNPYFTSEETDKWLRVDASHQITSNWSISERNICADRWKNVAKSILIEV